MDDNKKIKLVVVPKNHRHDIVAKGRAINYFTDNYIQDDKWHIFIDDDVIILDDKLYEIPF